ncbi:NUDIX hydrolase [Corynebacterium crudilactis]|uniref:NUDIX hydrolase n=1 Tax=Corynebacterium crudilactis TaxID=1652495 RepID=A0A172QT02_9CORY|nr:NUDIX hydrolase [Corynebacterium crudilactis]ANE03790.1 NUDIX hydrolase [Corynebacterium crudilactis]
MVMQGIGGRRLAATVLLVRDRIINGQSDVEVYIQERVSTMANFPRATVFPGGGVDSRDFADGHGKEVWRGPSAEDWALRLGVEPHVAYALVFAAIRELFEEAGTLLAEYTDGSGLVKDTSHFHDYRAQLETHEISLTDMLQKENLAIRSDLIVPFARWVSPEGNKGQFDTFSFIAEEPEGQWVDGDTSEASSTGYFPARLILDGWRAGLLRLVIPTWASLFELSQFRTVAQLMEFTENITVEPMFNEAIDNPRYAEFYQALRKERF